MKDFKEMSYNEKLDYLTGISLMSLGKGKPLREIISIIVNMIADEAYKRGYEEGKEENHG